MATSVNSSRRQKPWSILGLTGGIATGKSTASEILAKKGAVMIDADTIARDLTQPGKIMVQRILKQFGQRLGPKLLLADGQLNRALLNESLFSDASFRREMEDLLHPVILEIITNNVKQALSDAGSDLVILSAPLLFETGLASLCACTLVISCNQENQIKRLRKRDGYTRKQAIQRIQSQMNMAEKRRQATWTVENNGTRKALTQSIDKILPAILSYLKREKISDCDPRV